MLMTLVNIDITFKVAWKAKFAGINQHHQSTCSSKVYCGIIKVYLNTDFSSIAIPKSMNPDNKTTC